MTRLPPTEVNHVRFEGHGPRSRSAAFDGLLRNALPRLCRLLDSTHTSATNRAMQNTQTRATQNNILSIVSMTER